MFGGCIADRVIVNEEEIALADVRGFANVQFSPNSACRYVEYFRIWQLHVMFLSLKQERPCNI